MVSLRFYRITQSVLLLLLVGGILVWFLVRAPGGTSVGAIFGDVERIGRSHQVVLETVSAVRQLTTVRLDTSHDDIVALRAQVLQANDAAAKMAEELQTVKSQWMPVAEATVLLNECRSVGELALQQSPTGVAVPANVDESDESIEMDPDLDGMSAESVQILGARAEQLFQEWKRLELRVRQAIVGGVFARGSLLGLESKDLLLIATVLACLAGIFVLSNVCRRLKISPENVERMEIELISRTDRIGAMQRCHNRVHDLLQMADSLCRSQEI